MGSQASRIDDERSPGDHDAPIQTPYSESTRRARDLLDGLSSRYDGTPIDVSFRHMVGPLPANDRTHSIYPYPARLVRHIPRLISRASQIVDAETVVVDPFCGSGTVLLEAMSIGARAIGVDANPLAALVSTVKTTPVDPEALEGAAANVIRTARSKRARDAPAPYLEKWYTSSAISALSKISQVVQSLEDSPTTNVLKVALALTARQCALTDKRIPVPVRDPNLRSPASNLSVWSAFASHAERLEVRLATLPQNWATPTVVNADARASETWRSLSTEGTVCAITSPPYGAAQKYLRSTSLELGWLGYTGGQGTARLEDLSIGREHLRAVERNASYDSLPSAVQSEISTIHGRNPLRGDIYARYFLDMQQTFRSMSAELVGMQRVVLIAGENSVLGDTIPTHEYLVQMLHQLGFTTRLALRDMIRGRTLLSRRANSGTPAPAEYVYWLEREVRG
jgi:hypothetical protein